MAILEFSLVNQIKFLVFFLEKNKILTFSHMVSLMLKLCPAMVAILAFWSTPVSALITFSNFSESQVYKHFLFIQTIFFSHNFHMSECSFTYSGLWESWFSVIILGFGKVGLAWWLQQKYIHFVKNHQRHIFQSSFTSNDSLVSD